MTLYAETNGVLRWLFAEPGGDEIRVVLAAATKVTCSRLTVIETRRVVRRAEREARVSAAQGADVLAVAERRSFPDFAILTMDDRVRANAALLGFQLAVAPS